MNEEITNSIWNAAQIAAEEREVLENDWFDDHEFEIYMKPDGTIRLLRESEYFAKVPEGWERIKYDGHTNDELTEYEDLQAIVEEWMKKKNGEETK